MLIRVIASPHPMIIAPPLGPMHGKQALFAVGTLITERPPHRSGRAEFPHPAPTLMIWRQSAHWAKGEGSLVTEAAHRRSSTFAPMSGYVSGFSAVTFEARCV